MSPVKRPKFFYLLLFALFFLAMVVKADAPAQEVLPPRLNWEGRVRLPEVSMSYQRDDQSVSRQLKPAVYVPWSNLVYQSFSDGNWEIYRSPENTYDYVRLTNHVASDIHPRLNRGATKIVFASNRDGDYELYLMNPTGTGLTRLTTNTTDDVNPAWSPDGTRIAFQAYRDGQAEIYVMDADGSNQTRLTVDADYDTSPSWSPNGARIAFVSRRTGGYRIYVMDPDGSNLTQLSNQPYSLDPTWSPDGTRIAFDADGDGNSWQELWIMNADGSNQHRVHNPGNQKDAWARSWSPDGQYIAFTQISFVNYGGVWYWTGATMNGWSDDAESYTLLNPGRTLDWHPGWQTTDGDAPQSQVNALPAFSRVAGFELGWDGIDTGGSGLDSFDIQYRIGETGEWVDWQVETEERSALFAATPGTTVYFRSRARDHIPNVEEWPDEADTSTTFYSWGISGRVIDNAGLPVSTPTIETVPASSWGPILGSKGEYTLYVDTVSDEYRVNWSEAGYDSPPETTYERAEPDVVAEIVLPPIDDVVRNGDFETGELSPWLVSEAFTSSIISTAHTGDYGIQIGRERWELPLLTWDLVSDIPQSSMPHHIGFSANGHLHVVWHSYYDEDIHHIERFSDGTWSDPTNISDDPGESDRERFAIDNHNGVHVVWHNDDSDDIFYSWRPDGGDWSTPLNLTDGVSGSVREAELTVTEDKVHIIWPEYVGRGTYTLHYRWRYLDGAWSDVTTVASGLNGGWLKLTADSTNRLHLLWGPVAYDYEGFYWCKPDDGPWSEVEELPEPTQGLGYSDIVVEDDGIVHLFLWRIGGPEIYYSRRDASGNWSTPYLLANQDTQHFSLRAVLAQSNLHVIWSVNVNNDLSPNGLYYAQRTSDGRWSEPARITSLPSTFENASSMIASDEGGAHLIFNRDDSSYYIMASPEGNWSEPVQIAVVEIFGYSGAIATVAENDEIHLVSQNYSTGNAKLHHASFSLPDEKDLALSQSITVPLELNTPRLSFLYKLQGASETSGTGLHVTLAQGTANLPLATINSDAATWTHHSVDLTNWSGQTITLTFNAPQSSDAIPVWAALDDITIGSSYTDLWININKRDGLANDTVNHRLYYGNHGGGVAQGVRITATLPSYLTFVSAAPSPMGTGSALLQDIVWWDISQLDPYSDTRSILLTTTIDADAPIFTDLVGDMIISPLVTELEISNNECEWHTFVGRLVYLPLIAR